MRLSALPTAQIRDVDIRRRLDAEVRQRHEHEEDTLILHEMGLCQGAARVDLAVINGSLHGYEIKSEVDTLDRLPGQRAVYERALDFVTIVTAEKHAKKARRVIPPWWGIWAAVVTDNGLAFNRVRPAQQNPHLDGRAVAELLWRDEALEELELRELAVGLRSKPRSVLWERLAKTLPLDDLRCVVRKRLKQRQDRWPRAHVRPT